MLFPVEEFDSKEELLFYYYLLELKDAGFISEIVYHPEAFVLTDEQVRHAYAKGKRKNKLVNVQLLRAAHYTPDFKIIWEKRAKGVLYWEAGGVYDDGFFPYRKGKRDRFIPFYAYHENGHMTTYIDTKGAAARLGNKSGTTFSLIQKWMLSVYDVFVQKIVVSLDEKSFFEKTFTPRAVIANEVYKKDCKWGKEGESKLKYTPILLEQWLKKRQ